jgi:hypothetical protein
MGRGRAKAKQTKVARELKYSSQGTDFEALQRELAGMNRSNPDSGPQGPARSDDLDDEYDEYDDWAAGNR